MHRAKPKRVIDDSETILIACKPTVSVVTAGEQALDKASKGDGALSNVSEANSPSLL